MSQGVVEYIMKEHRELPDGDVITVYSERFHYVDVSLQSFFIDKYASRSYDVYICKELYSNVVCQVLRPYSVVLLAT